MDERNEMEVIEFDGVQLPVIRTNEVEARVSGCLNCLWHHLTPEEQEKEKRNILAIMEDIEKRQDFISAEPSR